MMRLLIVSLAVFLTSQNSVLASCLGSEEVRVGLEKAEAKLELAQCAKNLEQCLLFEDLELARSEFVRSFQLYQEGILARKDVDKNRITYEKTLLKLAHKVGKLKEASRAIASLRRTIPNIQCAEASAEGGGTEVQRQHY